MKIAHIFKNSPPGQGIISVDFEQTFIKIAYLKYSHDILELLNYDSKEIPATQETVSEAISFINNFLKANSIPAKRVFLTIFEPENTIIKYLTLPVLPKEEIPAAIKWQLKEETAFDLESCVFDWKTIREFSDEEGAKKVEIMCILVKREAIERYLSIVSNCQLVPIAISNSCFNYANILNSLSDESSISAILDIGQRHSAISIYRNSKLSFIRNLVVFSDKFAKSLSSTLSPDKDGKEISYNKAKEIIREFGIPKEEDLVLGDNIKAIHVISSMRPILESLAMDLKRSFDYFSSNFKEKKPSILYITGEGANLKNLVWYLKKELGDIELKLLPLPPGIKVQKINEEIINNNRNEIMSLLGALITGPGNINLLPEEIKSQKIESFQKVSLRIVAITVTAIFLFLLFTFKFQEYDYNKRLKIAQMHLQSIHEIAELKERILSRQRLIDRINKYKIPTYGILKQISNVVPRTIILNELFLDNEQNSLTLKGIVLSNDRSSEQIITDFMEKTEATPFFKTADILSSKNTNGVQEFEIKFTLAQ